MSGAALVVEADGGSRGNPGPAAYGALVRRAGTGELLAEVAEAIGVATNNVAEYRGLIAGLRAAFEIDPGAQVEARLDSKLVVEQLSGRWKIKHPDLRPLALEANGIFPPGQVTFTWVPRADNSHADALVNQALDGKPIGLAPTVEPANPAEPTDPSPAATSTAPPHRIAAWTPELGAPTTLLLVRHGHTELTAAARFSGGGVDGPDLDELGRSQAAALARILPSDVAAVVSSPLPRARQTAEILAAAREPAVTVRVDDGWRECDFGAWEGLTYPEVHAQYPAELAAWSADTAVAAPGGESFDELARRVAVARDRTIARYPGRSVVVVTHAWVIRALVAGALGAALSAMFRMRAAPGSVTSIDTYSDGSATVTGLSRLP